MSKSIAESSDVVSQDEDEKVLASLGYKQTLRRCYSLVESFSACFTAVNVISGLRGVFTFGIALGGPQAYWATYWISSVFILITAAVLAETCSALPAAGSIYLWAAASGGPRFGRLFGFMVAFWSTTAWTSFVASSAQVAANYMFAEIPVFGLSFDVDVTNVRFRAVQWIVSEGILGICLLVNYLPPHTYRYVFRIAMGIVIFDFLLNMIWLPIGVSKTYGFQSADFAFRDFENFTGGPNSWAWMLCFFATAGVQIGFDASGHVAEETKNAGHTAARGLFWGGVACIVMACPVVILFLFCMPSVDVLFTYTSPQPFVQLYAVALGHRAHVFMTALAILSTLASATVSVVAASRLVYAVARDGVLPFSPWISAVSPTTGQPRNAISFIGIVSAILLCSILPSSLAFQSLVSAAGVPTVAAWGLISFGRCFLAKPGALKPRFSLGRWSRPMQFVSFVWNTFLAACLFSPQEFPVTHSNLNYAPVIMGIITILALVSYVVLPSTKWLQVKKRILDPNAEDDDE